MEDDSDSLEELKFALRASNAEKQRKDTALFCRCGFEAAHVWELARHTRRCKAKRHHELELQLQKEGFVSPRVCLLLRQHLHVPHSACDAVLDRYLVGGSDALSALKPHDVVVNCAFELESLVQRDRLTLFCPARDVDDFPIVASFSDACAAFVRTHVKGRVLFHCAAGQSRSVS